MMNYRLIQHLFQSKNQPRHLTLVLQISGKWIAFKERSASAKCQISLATLGHTSPFLNQCKKNENVKVCFQTLNFICDNFKLQKRIPGYNLILLDPSNMSVLQKFTKY